MNWDKIGKFLSALIASIAGIAAIYATFFKGQADLEAHLTYSYQNYPRQFIQRLELTKEKLKYKNIYEKVRLIADGGLNHNQVDAIVELSQEPYLDIFSKPFDHGLDDYGVKLFIYLENNGEKPAKNVYIKLPSKGLVLIRDDAKNYSVLEKASNDIKIDAIVQNGTSKIWVYFDSKYENIINSEINIGHSDGVAKINVTKSFSGLSATVAKYSEELIILLAGLIVMIIALLTIEIFYTKNKTDS